MSTGKKSSNVSTQHGDFRWQHTRALSLENWCLLVVLAVGNVDARVTSALISVVAQHVRELDERRARTRIEHRRRVGIHGKHVKRARGTQ